MKKFTKILLLATLLVSILSVNINAIVTVIPTNAGTGWTGGTAVTNDAGETTAIGATSDSLVQMQIKLPAPVDISAYAEDGYFRIWMYVSNPDALSSNGQIELTSSGNCDVEETHWNVPYGDVVEGWNEIVLPFDMAEEESANYQAINFFRIYWFVEEGADLSAGNPIIRLANMDVAKFGSDFTMKKRGISWDTLTYPEMSGFSGSVVDYNGKASVSITSDSLLVSECPLTTPLDLSKYAADGYVHMWIYVEDVESFTSDAVGQFEITSSGAADKAETMFEISADTLKNGWNEIMWSLKDAVTKDADLSAVNYFRLYKNVSAPTTLLIRDIAFGTEAEMDMVPETEPETTEALASVETTQTPTETTAPTANDTASTSNNRMLYIIIGGIAVVAIVVIVVIVVVQKKKKK